MQPTLFKFTSVKTEDDQNQLTFVRFTSTTVQFLSKSICYEAPIDADSTMQTSIVSKARIQGSNQPVSTRLFNLLLHIPTTCSRIVNESHFSLKCRDIKGITLHVRLPVVKIAAESIMQDLVYDLISATVSLESALLEFSGDQNPSLDPLSEKEQSLASTISLYDLCEPGSQKFEKMSSFKKAAASDVYMQSTRAFVLAAKAKEIRTQILEQRRARKEKREQIVKKEINRVKAIKQAISQQKGKGRNVPIAKNKKRSFFEFCDDDHQQDVLRKEASSKTLGECEDRQTRRENKERNNEASIPESNVFIQSQQPKIDIGAKSSFNNHEKDPVHGRSDSELTAKDLQPTKAPSAVTKPKKKQRRKLV